MIYRGVANTKYRAIDRFTRGLHNFDTQQNKNEKKKQTIKLRKLKYMNAKNSNALRILTLGTVAVNRFPSFRLIRFKVLAAYPGKIKLTGLQRFAQLKNHAREIILSKANDNGLKNI